MEKIITDKFGYTIAFILPGFLTLLALSYHSALVNSWLYNNQGISSSIYVVLASLTVGIIISAIRWIIFDRGLLRKIDDEYSNLDYSKLQANLKTYKAIVEAHYHFYQFYSNMFVSIFISAGLLISYFISKWWLLILLVVAELILFWASKDCFNKSYNKMKQLL